MVELLALGTILLFGLLVIGLVGGVLKLIFWLVFLPLRLAGGILKLLVGLLFLPILLIVGVVAFVGFGIVALLGLLLPILPLVLAGLLVWGLVKVFSRPAAASRA